MAGTAQTRELVARALNAILSSRSSENQKLVGVLQLSELLNRGTSAIRLCLVDTVSPNRAEDAVFNSDVSSAVCSKPFVYAPETAQEAVDALRPTVRRIGQLARASGGNLEATFISWLNAAGVGELSARKLDEFPTVKVVDSVHSDLNGDLTLVFIATALVDQARLEGEDIPLPSLLGKPVEGMTPAQLEIYNEIAKTVNTWVSGANPWLTHFLVCISIMRFFESRSSSLDPAFASIYRRLRRETYDAVKAYQNGFVLWRETNSGSADILPQDFRKAVMEAELSLDATSTTAAATGAAVAGTTQAATVLIRKIMMLAGKSAVAGSSLPAALLLGGTFAAGAATQYGLSLTEQFADLAENWKCLARAYDLREINPRESRRILKSCAMALQERCRVGSKVECYLKLGLAASVSTFAYYKWLKFSNDQLTSS